jgi:hypothetical protein
MAENLFLLEIECNALRQALVFDFKIFTELMSISAEI